ncbi:ABC-2 transporter permease [Bacillus tuaregi]|uniref:ABC-2 transporter permease n=1 Tax=Bacillus tuaregi TaxID=1816695 RepID=UPI0008F94C9B|nr:ABC-2 transporter permease [Bacillus tuaregi]
MFQLMLKDFHTQRKVAYFIPLLLLTYLLTLGKEVSGDNPIIEHLIFGLSIACIAYFMMMYSNFNLGESERMQNRLLLSLPIERKTVINAKYAMIFAWWLISFISYSLLVVILKQLFHMSITLSFDLKVMFLSLCFAYLLCSIFYPIYYKFGYRVSSLIGILFFFVVTSGFGKLLTIKTSLTSIVVEHPFLSVAILSFAFTLLSYLVSTRIYSKADF